MAESVLKVEESEASFPTGPDSKPNAVQHQNTPPSPSDSEFTSSNSTKSIGSPQRHHNSSDISSNSSGLDDEEAKITFPLPPPSTAPSEILPQDQSTPDSHVPRDPRLIRLTGTHPFNVEAPLSALFDEGFLTSPELFYVRNHGAVPQVDADRVLDWEFSVEGLVEHPLALTLRDLLDDHEQVTVPITLVCAGNRRKEQNVVRKSKGFSWGAAGVSTALWTGVPLADLLRRAAPRRGARFVCLEGADRLPNGPYGTSVKLNWALDPNRGIMLAHKMNGEALRPDHGLPLRAVVPGQIGGRSVKWLKRIVVTSAPSDNWYHIYDNRVLPTMVSPEQSAREPRWWTDERYAIYDLSTNSAVAYPAHGEQLRLAGAPQSYRARGYAYGGGGRRVTRVEATLDRGKSWLLADIKYHEDAYRDPRVADGQRLYGGRLDMGWRETCFCWCFWEIELAVAALADAGDLMVRAMDESMNVQPRDMYWSVLGMMNNPWFRVAVTREGDYLRFEHPTQPALLPGGWMERVKKAGGNLTNGMWGEKLLGGGGGGGEEDGAVMEEPAKEIPMTKDGLDRQITIDELRKHDGDAEPWFVVNGEVYDGTKFLEGHPGGATSITGAAGSDASDEFMAIHSETAKAMMTDYHIGSLDEAARSALADPGSGSSSAKPTEPRAVFLQSKTWTAAPLVERIIISSDTRIFSFALEHAEQTIGLPTGQHLMMRLRDSATRDAIVRSYTPISEGRTTRGRLDVLVKVYFDDADPAGGRRKGGRMTQALDRLPLGQTVDFKGPVGRFEYLGRGRCSLGGGGGGGGREQQSIRHVRRFVMICAGSGVTPIFQVLRAVLSDPGDETRCLVLDGNRLEEDILCRKDIDELVRGNEGRCRLLYSLSMPTDGWTGLRGRVGKELLEREVGRCGAVGAGGHCYEKGEELVLICGPEPFEKALLGVLRDLGWSDDDLLSF